MDLAQELAQELRALYDATLECHTAEKLSAKAYEALDKLDGRHSKATWSRVEETLLLADQRACDARAVRWDKMNALVDAYAKFMEVSSPFPLDSEKD